MGTVFIRGMERYSSQIILFQVLKKSSSTKTSAKFDVTTAKNQKSVIDVVSPTKPAFKRQVNSRVIAVGIPGANITDLKTPVLHAFKHTINEVRQLMADKGNAHLSNSMSFSICKVHCWSQIYQVQAKYCCTISCNISFPINITTWEI